MASVGCITLLTIYLWIHVFYCEGQGAVILPFWDPEPNNLKLRQHGRRFNILPNHSNVQRIRKQRQQIYGDRWNSRRNNPPVEAKNGSVSTSNVSDEDIRKSGGNRYKILRNIPGRSQQNYVRQQNDDLDKEVTILPRSTRMTPLYLMQQDGVPDEEEVTRIPVTKNENKSEYDDRFVLNPYDIESQFKQLMAEFPEVDFESEILGRTASYNNILLLKFKKKDSTFFRAEDHFVHDEDKEKKIVFIVHALSPMGLNVLYTLTIETYLKTLLSYYFQHLDKFDIYLMPLANPDGYVHLKNKPDTFWHKNVSPQADCPGVDLDRNFDVAWNSTIKISSCDQRYPGPKPFSEPESKAVRDVLHKYSFKIVAYIHVHAGTHYYNVYKGDAVLYPKGYSDHPSDDDKYLDLRGEIDEAIKNANFRSLTVTVDTLHNWYGTVTGTSVDYASTVYGIPYAMEWVMQIRQDPIEVNQERLQKGVLKELDYNALTEVWSRVIESVFTSMSKKLDIKDDTRRRY